MPIAMFLTGKLIERQNFIRNLLNRPYSQFLLLVSLVYDYEARLRFMDTVVVQMTNVRCMSTLNMNF